MKATVTYFTSARGLAGLVFMGLLASILIFSLGSFARVSGSLFLKYGAPGAEEIRGYWTEPGLDVTSLDLDPVLYERLRRPSGFEAWWGNRPRPSRAGGDYLAVLSRAPIKSQTSSWLLGALIESERAAGRDIEELVIPKDSSLLFVVPDVYEAFPRADGTFTEIDHAVFRPSVVHMITDVPLVEIEYDPVLTEEQIAKTELGHAIKVQDSFSIVELADVEDSTWVLHAGPTAEYEFYLLPMSVSPVGDEP